MAGGRDFADYELMKFKLNHLLSQKKDIEIISGGARGADSLGERYAKERQHCGDKTFTAEAQIQLSLLADEKRKRERGKES